jgi:hypothetical protein
VVYLYFICFYFYFISILGLADDIRVLVMKDDRELPSLTAQVAMPVSEQSLID